MPSPDNVIYKEVMMAVADPNRPARAGDVYALFLAIVMDRGGVSRDRTVRFLLETLNEHKL